MIKFEQYKLSNEVLEALRLFGYKTPTPIQNAVIPILLEGKNVVGKAQTGSGKTAAFAIPICERIIWDENAPQALILEPTRELTVQVQQEVFLLGRRKRLKVADVFGGFPIDKQIQTLRQKTHIVVGTPGRVMDHIRRESLHLNKVKYLVIDEADLMLDMGFVEEVKEILSRIPKGCQISLFSATLQPKIQELVDDYVRETTVVEMKEEKASQIDEIGYYVTQDEKFEVFIKVLIEENPKSCIIFCGTREMVNVLFQKMKRKKIFCGMIHGEMEQRERLKTMAAFKRGVFRYLVATDVAARGIDLEEMSHVINYDFPTGRETYVHRIGRTGRNGKSGKAISFICDTDIHMLEMIESYRGEKVPIKEIPNPDEGKEKEFWSSVGKKDKIKEEKGAKLNQGILRLTIGGGRKSKMRAGDIVGAICSIEGIEVTDIGIIDVRESKTNVEILNDKGKHVFATLQTKPIKGKIRKIKMLAR
ncbi:ATP-dependent RNA helicase DeaD [Aequitasia blattaphilus]|uniref:DEAD/DEAH box helicase n=1 Tax=Aequitasia blattaphilus TaxID=2949332 RepID=A0ABT1E854_9FIRM|nr:DEAD/DEAH box helicase [Aequitasia blattaphilus]MCP1101799.1 DEAD/DEAH box helicase [Aequitasia blattaphilus]MCR8614439.1 DEAD/DEAH box helicase [Aequitasia blattaphilus]